MELPAQTRPRTLHSRDYFSLSRISSLCSVARLASEARIRKWHDAKNHQSEPGCERTAVYKATGYLIRLFFLRLSYRASKCSRVSCRSLARLPSLFWAAPASEATYYLHPGACALRVTPPLGSAGGGGGGAAAAAAAAAAVSEDRSAVLSGSRSFRRPRLTGETKAFHRLSAQS